MVAYSFKARFAAPILSGTKRQTVRADRKRHARQGEELQLYTGMRTKQCRLIGRATCRSVLPIAFNFKAGRVTVEGLFTIGTAAELDAFAVSDGFADWSELRGFWKAEHGAIERFSGVIVHWGELK